MIRIQARRRADRVPGRWGITEAIVKEFCKQYEKVYKIRGHGSGDESDEKNAHTQLDLDIFHAWYRRNYPDGHD
jgi:hypothetical protein